MAMPRKSDRLMKWLGWLTFGWIALALYMAFVYAPPDTEMGNVQRIFYFHVPSFWAASLAFFLVFLGGVQYLRTRQMRWDTLAACAAEIGVVFTTLVLLTGSIWGKAAWGTWWTWDPRLTTTLVLWLIYISYLMLRASLDEARGATFAAVFGIVGFVDVPIVFMAIRWWRSLHPNLVTEQGIALAPPMLLTLLVALGAFTVLFAYMLLQRLRLQELRNEVDSLRQELEI